MVMRVICDRQLRKVGSVVSLFSPTLRSFDQPLAERDCDGVSAASRRQPTEDPLDVMLDGLLSQEEVMADLAVRATLGDEFEDGALAIRQQANIERRHA